MRLVVLKVDPAVEAADPYLRTRGDWKSSDSFRLIFLFQSQGAIEMDRKLSKLFPYFECPVAVGPCSNDAASAYLLGTGRR
jgi:hypothetical protein